jgi:hypothetical protein
MQSILNERVELVTGWLLPMNNELVDRTSPA